MLLTSYFVPVIFGAVLLYGTYKKVPVFDAFLEGAKENLKLGVDLLPTLIALLTVVSLVKASGLTDLLTSLCAPFLSAVGFPAECIPLALIRPISGSGSLAVYESLLDSYGPDSTVGTIASVLQGSSETTFYTIAVERHAMSEKCLKTKKAEKSRENTEKAQFYVEFHAKPGDKLQKGA